MPTQPASYGQYLVPDTDAGPNQWGATGANHWAEIDESHLAPDCADRIFTGGAAMGGRLERFGVTLPNHENLEGGFDSIVIAIHAYRSLPPGPNVPLNLDLYIKGAWQGPQQVLVIGGGAGGAVWYTKQWDKFNCDVNDADPIQIEIEVDPGSVYPPLAGVVVCTAYAYITGRGVLLAADAKKSSLI